MALQNTDVTRDAPRAPLAPVDESVRIPDSVKAAAAKADAYYAQPAVVDPPVQPDPVPVQNSPQPDPPAPPAPVVDPPAPVVDPAVEQPEPPAGQADVTISAKELHALRSQAGRTKKQSDTITQMQETMSQMGDEIMRLQTIVPAVPAAPVAAARPGTKLITPEDEEAYGADLLGVVQRAALEAVAPKLQSLEADNATLKNQLKITAQTAVNQALDDQVPTWRDINKNPKWKNWLRLRDLYSGQVRQRLLDDAARAADAPRVVSFFKGFIADEAAMGSTDLVPLPEPPAPPAPRTAAVDLGTLTAPGRAKPAGGDNQHADKPVYTHKQIAAFYDNIRRGAYAGRDADKNATEADIFAAQREGRVR